MSSAQVELVTETTRDMRPILSGSDLTLAAPDGSPILNGVTIDIEHGATTVILGANGAGKSVLLRVLHGLLLPDRGRVVWAGKKAHGPGEMAQAMVFQRPVLLRRSVLANMRFALWVRGVPRAERQTRALDALKTAGLAHLADRPARRLSGGEQQRLSIARALALRPQLLFLDEPTAHLDPASTLAVEDMVRAARRSGVTVVLVTHDIGQARRLGDRAVFLHRGRIEESGPAARLLAHPRSAAARAWFEGRIYVDPVGDVS